MTAPMRSTPHASALPASQTAPVAEFRCLFTQDIRRKQKRWQDGYLKFHTFNNRVMVTDQARNHIGETYWKDSNDIQEGDELSLDKGVLVEVAEAMGITQTDLAPLFDRKGKEPPKDAPPRPKPSAPPRPFQRPSTIAPSNAARAGSQLRHKSLNTLLGTPQGPVGKAQPMKSPYEARKEKEKENEMAEERSPKRQKVTRRPGEWRASSPVEGDESPPAKNTPLWAKTADARNNRKPQARMPPVSKAITISSESDHILVFTSDDVTLPSSPAKAAEARPRPTVTSAPAIPSSVLHEPVFAETSKPPRARIRLPKPKPVETPKRPAPNSSPPVSASNRITNVDFAVQPVEKPAKAPSPQPSALRNPKAKSLRLSAGVRRGTLLCQSIPKPALRVGSEPRASGSRRSNSTTSRPTSKEPSPAISLSGVSTGRAGPRISPPVQSRKNTSVAETISSRRQSRVDTPDARSVEDAFDDPELIHGLMDQQLQVLSSPVKPLHPPSPPLRKAPVTKPAVQKPVPTKTPKAHKRAETNHEESTEAPNLPKPPISKPVSKKAKGAKPTLEMPTPSRTLSPPQSVFQPPAPPSRGVSPTHTDASGPPSRTSSKSPSKPLLSTGGFRKKPSKRTAKESAAATTVTTPNVTMPVPPHSLTNGKSEPLMSTTEIAAVLRKPKKRARKDDTIEDDAAPTGRSPARKMRRVRSENDAPIPSTAEDWEKRNLPKTPSNLTEAEAEPEPKKKESALAALVKKTDPRKKLQRTQSLSIDTGVDVEGEVELPSPVIDKDVGPWSTEAGDLFDWKPPGREASGQVVV